MVAVIAVGVGFAAAGDGGTSQASSGMTGGTTMGTGMMGSSSGAMSEGMMSETSGGMMGATSMGSGTMSAGSASLMSADMEGMHEQMMAAMAGMVPADMLARCDALHDQMMPDTATAGAESAGHASHHGGVNSTG